MRFRNVFGNGLSNQDYKSTALFPWESNGKNSERISAWMVDDGGKMVYFIY